MKKIIIILFFFIATNISAQIDPYQIIKDSLGAHRILLTDSTGEYTRVLLRDAIVDSIGVGKFVNGTNPLDAVYMDGDVGIGTTNPSEKLHVSGNAIIDGVIKSENLIEVNATNNSSSKIEIGRERTTNGYSWIDLVGDATYSDYGLRIIRNNSGANTSSDIHHRGTGHLRLIAREAAPISFTTTNAERVRIVANGNVGIGTTNPDKLLVVSGDDAQIVINDTDATDTPRIRLRESGATSGSIYTDNKELIFDSGTAEAMRIKEDGKVGIGKIPTEKLDVDGNIKYSGTLFNGSREEYNNSNIVRVNQIYDGNLVGSYFETGDYQKILTVTPDGSSEGYHITGNIYVQSGAEVQTLEIDVSLRSQTLPDLVWEISYNNNHTGISFLKPFLWTKETTTASFILGFEVLAGTIYGSATADLTINCRNSNDKDNIVLNDVAASDQLTVDAGFTERDFDLKIESAPSVPIISNGQFVGKYPKDSGLQNVVFGNNNLSSQNLTNGSNNFVNGQYNATASTTNHRNLINGERNFRYATPVIQYSFANGYNNNANNVSSASYSMLNGIYNLEEAQNLAYTLANGKDNGKTLAAANYSFFSGYRNAYNSTASAAYNTFIGRENAVGAADIDYSVFLGYQNNYSGNNSNIDYSFIAGERNAYNAGSMFATNIMGYRNAYTTSNTLNYFTAIGRENAYYPTVPMNNTILLGYRQAYNVGSEGAGSYKLAIGMYEDNPLIYGEFDNALVKINGELEVTGSIETDGDLGAAGELNITGEVTFSNSLTVQGDTDISAGELLANDVIVLDRTGGAAVKSAFFDSGGQLIEGDLVSGGQSVTCKIETTSNQTISSTGSPFVVFDSQTIDNGSLSSDLTNNKITINEDGLYMVLFYIKLKGGNGAEFDVEIDVNGSAKEDHYQTLDSDDLMTVSGSYVGSFSDGDDVKIQIGQVTSDSGQAVENIYTGSSLTVIRL